jgi:NADH:ubiquinone reductase (non-electrogenic)
MVRKKRYHDYCMTKTFFFRGLEMYYHSHPAVDPIPFDSNKKTIVVLGSGWASTSFLKSIDTDLYNVVVVSPRNYFLFTPLLPSCTVGTLDFRSLVEPIRFITRHKKNEVKVYEAECTEIDSDKKVITIVGKVQNECAMVGSFSKQ